MKQLPMGALILDIAGLTLTPEDRELLLHPQVAGVIFFSRNYHSPEQMKALVQSIRRIRAPLLLCVDQEGGCVQRFIQGLTRLPPLAKIGQISDRLGLAQAVKLSEQLGQLMALEVRALGVDLSFAPVLDLKGISQVIKDRAFHASPQIISALAAAYIKGMKCGGMQATGKHFPGHGSVVPDSHVTLPQDERTFEEIAADLAPFQALIQKGIAALMPAHIVYPHIDRYPVGFSHYWLQTLLRQRLNFQGAIISDDLSMQAASIIGDEKARAQQAIEAGCDLLLVCNNRLGAISVLENLTGGYDETTQHRRLSMLGQKAPSWPSLKQSPLWQSAYQAIEQLNAIDEKSGI